MKSRLNSLLSAGMMLGAVPAMAATPIGDFTTFSGFGTLGAVQTDTDDAEFIRNRQLKGATDNADFITDSNVGLQVSSKPFKWLSGTVQVLAMQQMEPNIDVNVEWAFVTITPIDNLSLRGGRMTLPMFAVSDSRNVGYANTWIRPPDEVYGMALLSRLEGGDVTYRLETGPVTWSLTGLVGESSFLGGASSRIDADKVRGVNLQVETKWATFRFGRVTADVPIAGDTDGYTFTGFGVTLEHEDIVGQAEYVTRRSDLFGSAVDADGWYVLGGYRFGAATPYASYSKTEPQEADSPFHLSAEQTTFALGVRWDAFPSAAIKLQLQRTDTNDTSGISFITQSIVVAPGAPSLLLPVTDPVYVGSLAIDFVF